MASYHRVTVLLIVLFFGVPYGYADKIYLKDGTVEVSERVWQSELYVHFILKGTKGVVIRYTKDIVDRVVVDGVEEAIAARTPPKTTVGPIESDLKGNLSGNASSGLKAPVENTPSPRPIIIDQGFIQDHKGISFYDPRREKRYWAFKNSRHPTLSDALKALAQLYGQPVQWVETHMGTENDLGNIHQKLMMHGGGRLERPMAKNKPNLSHGDVEATKPQKSDMPAAGGPAETIASAPAADTVPKSLEFYNPRRTKKYWTSQDNRYNSLTEAMQALAKQYGVTVDWIDQHMGNTNDLALIHRNIQKSLK